MENNLRENGGLPVNAMITARFKIGRIMFACLRSAGGDCDMHVFLKGKIQRRKQFIPMAF